MHNLQIQIRSFFNKDAKLCSLRLAITEKGYLFGKNTMKRIQGKHSVSTTFKSVSSTWRSTQNTLQCLGVPLFLWEIQSKKDQCFYQTVLFVPRKNQGLLKYQEMSRLLNKLGIRTSFSQVIEILGWCPAESVLAHGEVSL